MGQALPDIFASLHGLKITVDSTFVMSPPKTAFHLKLTLPSNPRFLCVVRAAIGELGVIYGLSNEERIEVTLAIDEALANVIRHAYKNREDEKIEFECLVNGERMEFTLLDQGEPPDPAKICGKPLDECALSGRGTHLMRAIMDEMSYQKVSGGNQLKLVKRLPGAEARTGECDPGKR
jgi:anti-sigma regulatory factor (Ser/Thr protein kinase)